MLPVGDNDFKCMSMRESVYIQTITHVEEMSQDKTRELLCQQSAYEGSRYVDFLKAGVISVEEILG